MKIATKNHVFKTLEKYNLIAKKGYGQNFLINENITTSIVNNMSISKKDLIIEIGPGLGALTEELLDKFDKVVAIEIDKNMVQVLNDTFDMEKLEVINQDFLKIDLNDIFNKNIEYKEASIVSNLPYYITSDILEKIILYRENKINKMVVMMQKEVGKKLVKSDEKVDTFLKFLIDNYCSIKELVYVSKNDFIPRPNVDSIVLEIEINKSKNYIKDEKEFFNILKNCLVNKRKILISNLVGLLNKNKDEIIKIFDKLNIKETVRIEELSIKDYINLVNKLI